MTAGHNLKFVAGLLALIVVAFGLEAIPSLDLASYGLVPRTLRGIPGILAMPFLHANLGHLLANLGSLVALLGFLLLFHAKNAISVIVEVIVLGGILLWLFGRTANHIGASGLVYGVALFLISSGLSQRRILQVIASVVVMVMYGGSLVWGLLPLDSGVSWDGHLAGAVAGTIIGIYGESQEGSSQKGKIAGP
ncbi:MAG: rhomboid family intramembrane serine protease [Planctomycetota bacterium]|nr:rhomboid family intramembrane serine protease [Planctomycetota bacterium]